MRNIKEVCISASEWQPDDYIAYIECPYCKYLNAVFTSDLCFTRLETCDECGQSYELSSDYD